MRWCPTRHHSKREPEKRGCSTSRAIAQRRIRIPSSRGGGKKDHATGLSQPVRVASTDTVIRCVHLSISSGKNGGRDQSALERGKLRGGWAFKSRITVRKVKRRVKCRETENDIATYPQRGGRGGE